MKFFGQIGYGTPVEEPANSGVWVDMMSEYPYFGDVIRNTRQLEIGDKVNSDIVVSNSISILADEIARKRFFDIKYVRWMGVIWTVTSVEVRNPRLILTLGSVYNGPTA